MDNPRLAGRYAKSLIDLAIEQDQLGIVYKDISFLRAICKSNPDFVSLLNSPIIPADKKTKIIEAVLKDQTGNLAFSFIKLLINKNRESNLAEIANAFIDQYNEIKNIHRVKITTAIPLSDEIKRSIVEKVKTIPGIGEVELEAIVKQELIGGFVLETDNKLVDVSVLRDLKDVKKQFTGSEYVYKIR